MSDPTGHLHKIGQAEEIIRKNVQNQKINQSAPPSRPIIVLFRIYFICLIGISSIFLVYYWPQVTFEERIHSFNSTITNDTIKLNLVKNELNVTSVSSPEYQILLDKAKHLDTQIKVYENETDNLRMKLDGIDPFKNYDWFFIGTVKNFVIVTLAGLLGGSVAAFKSFNRFLGNKRLKRRWNSWYIFRPLQGGTMGLITYVLIRSGVYAGVPGASLDNANLFVVAAGAIVAGLYSDEIYSKFREVFATLFHSTSQQADTLEVPVRYPAIVSDIIDDSLVTENEIVVLRTKDTSLADQKYKKIFNADKIYWMIQLRNGKEGVYWISDEDSKVICHYTVE